MFIKKNEEAKQIFVLIKSHLTVARASSSSVTVKLLTVHPFFWLTFVKRIGVRSSFLTETTKWEEKRRKAGMIGGLEARKLGGT